MIDEVLDCSLNFRVTSNAGQAIVDGLNAVNSDVCSRFVFPCYVVSEQGLPTAT